MYIATFWVTAEMHRNAHIDKMIDNCAHAGYSILSILVHLRRNSLYMQNNNA